MPSLIIPEQIIEDLDAIGDRWNLLILRDIFQGSLRFEHIRKNLGISKATLTRRFDDLIARDILVKKFEDSKAARPFYKLSKKGELLYPSAVLCFFWEKDWGSGYKISAGEDRHKDHTLIPRIACQSCDATVEFEDIGFLRAPGDITGEMSLIAGYGSSRRIARAPNNGEPLPMEQISEIIGDRWVLLILICAFLGMTRFEEFHNTLSIATNILSTKLKLLVQADIVTQRTYQQNPPRHEYILTDKGKSLRLIVLSMRQWAMRSNKVKETLFSHRVCGSPLEVSVVCTECNEQISYK